MWRHATEEHVVIGRVGPLVEDVVGEPAGKQIGQRQGQRVVRLLLHDAGGSCAQSMSANRKLMMSHARSPVVTASRVTAASRAAITSVAHACTTRRSTSSESTGRIAWERLTPASPAASTRSLRPVN